MNSIKRRRGTDHLSVMKKYSRAEELTQAIVQELIWKVNVTDPRAYGDCLKV